MIEETERPLITNIFIPPTDKLFLIVLTGVFVLPTMALIYQVTMKWWMLHRFSVLFCSAVE